MPSIIRSNIAAGTANALTGLKNNTVGPDGAFVTLFASTAVALGTIDFTAEGGNLLIADGAAINIEVSADVVTVGVDTVCLNEPVGPGELFLAVVGQVANFNLQITDQPQVFG